MTARAVTPCDLARFLEVGRALESPAELPALQQQLAFELSPASAFAARGSAALFTCGAEGRVAALVHDGLRSPTGEPFGQLGYVACVDDVEVARALFAAAEGWLRDRGARQVLGPMNGGAHRLHRLLVSGHGTAPFLFEPRNPPYLPGLFEAAGYAPIASWYSSELPREAALALRPRVERLLRRSGSTARVERLDPQRPEEAFARLLPLLDAVWAGHVGYAPLALGELAEALGGVLPLMRGRQLGILVEGGRDIGVGIAYPDYAVETRALAGDAAGFGRWPDPPASGRLVLHTVAVIPEARSGGAALALIDEGLRELDEGGYGSLLFALVTDNLPFLGGLAPPERHYALYGKGL